MSEKRVTLADIRRILIEVAGAPEAGDSDDLEELGYDSIAVVAAVEKVERDYGVKVDEDLIWETKKISSLVDLINAA